MRIIGGPTETLITPPLEHSDAMGEREIPKYETDWLANCVDGYGFGYTKSQALMEMMKNVSADRDELTVQLIEHKGSASMSPIGAHVEELVQEDSVTIEGDTLEDLQDIAIQSYQFDHITESIGDEYEE